MSDALFKIKPQHLERKALVYIRQSTARQVHQNTASQQLQYAMAGRARKLGWRRVEVIDSDLGCSASAAAETRRGFETLLSSVALGEVGIVMSREVSRLSRSDKDWCRLLEVCQLFDTLVGDEQHIYELSNLDDQLVLGIKGTLSVIELKIMNMRMVQGQEEKARRGEMLKRLPVGYIKDAKGRAVLDPDVRIREAVDSIFDKFIETTTVRQTFCWFRDHDIELPANQIQGSSITWRIPSQPFIRDVLGNPFYAGAYVWGRRPMKTVLVDGQVKKRQDSVRPAEKCRVFIPDHHEGYITWDRYQENQRMISGNRASFKANETIGAIRAGKGLLAGLIRCGHCGRKLHVRYWGGTGTSPRYLCKGEFDNGGDYCIAFGGGLVDLLFTRKILDVIGPMGVDASLLAVKQIESRDEIRYLALQRQIELHEYEVQRAFEQYDAVDARNRLVASTLEERWNDSLSALETARARLAELDRDKPKLEPEQEQLIGYWGAHFKDLWESKKCPADLKKKIFRSIIEEVVVSFDAETNKLKFVVHWRGGCHTELEMTKATPATAQRTPMEALDIIRKMAKRYGDNQIASVLNRLGHRTGKAKRWNQTRVATARRNHSIPGQKRVLPDENILSMSQAAKFLKVSTLTVRKMGEAGLFKMEQVTPRAPWEIRRKDLEAESIHQIVERLHKTGRLILKGGVSENQQNLFTENKGVDNARHHV